MIGRKPNNWEDVCLYRVRGHPGCLGCKEPGSQVLLPSPFCPSDFCLVPHKRSSTGELGQLEIQDEETLKYAQNINMHLYPASNLCWQNRFLSVGHVFSATSSCCSWGMGVEHMGWNQWKSTPFPSSADMTDGIESITFKSPSLVHLDEEIAKIKTEETSSPPSVAQGQPSSHWLSPSQGSSFG